VVPVALAVSESPVVLVALVAWDALVVRVARVVSESPAVQAAPVAEPELVRVVGVLQDRARNRRHGPAGPAAPTK
jgi:hypothetical protein